jgi:hypothetical protein
MKHEKSTSGVAMDSWAPKPSTSKGPVIGGYVPTESHKQFAPPPTGGSGVSLPAYRRG